MLILKDIEDFNGCAGKVKTNKAQVKLSEYMLEEALFSGSRRVVLSPLRISLVPVAEFSTLL